MSWHIVAKPLGGALRRVRILDVLLLLALVGLLAGCTVALEGQSADGLKSFGLKYTSPPRSSPPSPPSSITPDASPASDFPPPLDPAGFKTGARR